MSAPRQGHMVGVLRILAYLHHHIRSKIVADPEYRDWSHKAWTHAEWQEFYPDATEPIPHNAPEARGKPVQINLFCDAAHATCLITRRSTTGIIIFLNGMPILWYSKRQNTLETSTFGSEFVALCIAIEMNDALRIKLCMLGIPLDGPTNGFCDNKSVVKNSSIPESRLSKKHNAIAYHKVRESCACNSIRIGTYPMYLQSFYPARHINSGSPVSCIDGWESPARQVLSPDFHWRDCLNLAIIIDYPMDKPQRDSMLRKSGL